MSSPTALSATVATYDAGTRSGTLLRDDGTRLAFHSGALDPDVRLLRSGQRVRVTVQAEDEQERVVGVGLPLP